MNVSYNDLMMKLSEYEFVCVELNEYLDTHPGDERALRDYNCYCQKLKALKAKFEHEYGPLQDFGHSAVEQGSWVQAPWPWEAS